MSFDNSLPITLKFEGGYSNDPDDPGGATNFGITQNTYDPTGVKNVKDITPAEVYSIYQESFWIAGHCDVLDTISTTLSLVHFDCGVNCGLREAVLILQRACNVTADGIFGPLTLQACKTTDALVLSNRELDQRAAFYQLLVTEKPELQKFLNTDWLPRVNQLRNIIND
jgi:lysozyme family protein